MINRFYQESFTFVPVKEAPFKLNPNSKSMFIGSCFSSNLFHKYESLFLNVTNAPFGNIYNPLSLSNSLKKIVDLSLIKKEDCMKIDGLYQHFDFHSKSGNENLDDFILVNNKKIKDSHTNLLESELLIITLGTAYVFEKDNNIVNNCHKIDKNAFNRRLLSIDEIKENIIPVLKNIKALNNNINIVITLSPVRHLRDDPAENSLSKALLRVAIDQIIKECSIYYFPSYEILLDELRDYRWYDKSLNHPNDEAINYILNRFIDSTSNNELKAYIKRAEKMNLMLSHKIINKNSESSQLFIKKRELVLQQLQKDFKGLKKLQTIKSSGYL